MGKHGTGYKLRNIYAMSVSNNRPDHFAYAARFEPLKQPGTGWGISAYKQAA